MYFKRITLRGERLVKFLRLHIESAASIIKEQLDCKNSFHRQNTPKTIEEILEMVYDASFIYCTDEDHEICLIVYDNGVDYFLWIRDEAWVKRK